MRLPECSFYLFGMGDRRKLLYRGGALLDALTGETPPLELCGEGYPLSWEASASQADYEGMRAVSAEYVARRICAPHTWHAAEMFLYLMEAG